MTRPAAAWALHPWNLPRPKQNQCRSCQAHVKCSQTVPRRILSADEEAAVESAARASYHLSTRNISAASTADLHTFCAVKGVSITCNPWDRALILSAAQTYVEDERIVQFRKGTRWEGMSNTERIRLCHYVCNGEGDVTYLDPATGFTVFTFFGHLKRGNCCGVQKTENAKGYERTHRCRHCPYTDDGRLVSKKTVALKHRIPVIEGARERAQEFWSGAAVSVSTPASPRIGQVSFETARNYQEAIVGSHLRKKVNIESNNNPEECECAACLDEQVVTCTRCNGWTYLFSPCLMKCPQCTARGFHACMKCTPFRPPSRSSFYS